jgi:uncharacterized membrane protein YraQ (UPF0718 family)
MVMPVTQAPTETPPEARRAWRFGSVEALALLLVLVVVFQGPVSKLLSHAALATWTTVFIAVVTQAMPFLVFGVVLSAVIAVFVPPSFFARVLPSKPVLAVPVATSAGVVLPGCECASVPVAGALVRRGVTPAAAFAFLLASPAVNPIVLVSTAVAFPGQPRVVIARALASLVVACLMGWLWQAFGKGSWLRMPSRAHLDGMEKWPAFWASVRHDVLHAGGFLVIGAASAAVIGVVVPKSWLAHLAADPVIAIVVLGLLAVLLSICSEADAFVAASLTQFSMTARLAFDLKLFAMQAGIFGRGFALRFAPATFVLAVAVSAVVGTVLL